ncbi:FtsX-like permease family protein [Cellulomonas alba]|uniref:FtsX-like permease family protein n=1 Tax=Cellulomonas alba TaxID=3053467 RepID=A0ABT7SHG0_9CELL|nr:FtsX-like permease family protein [Cellulomonas alba]MDM7855626.1 FtsX-like permease family protein [Cellulomonas alba]
MTATRPDTRPGLRRRLATGSRAATADAWLVSRRRSGADLGLLALSAALLAVTVFLALLVPRLVLRSADHAVHEAVRSAGIGADVLVQVPGQTSISTTRDPNIASEAAGNAEEMSTNLPPTLRSVLGAPLTSIVTRPSVASGRDKDGTSHAVSTRLVYVPGQESQVRWVQGVAPASPPPPADDAATDGDGVSLDDPTVEGSAVDAPDHVIEVGVEQRAAAHLGLKPGTELWLQLPSRGQVDVRITGLYTAVDPSAPAWSDLSDLLAAGPAPDKGLQGRIAMLLTDESLPDMELWIDGRSFTEQQRFPVVADAIDSSETHAVEHDVRRVVAAPALVLPGQVSPPLVSTSLGDVLAAQDVRQAAANAQQSVLEVGLAAAGALALVLAARLLVTRRQTYLLAERARGASTVSVAVRALVESVPLVVVAAGVGAGAAWLVLPDARGSWSIAALVAVVAVLAPAVLAVLQVRTAWSGRRLPANRADRQRVLGRQRARRITAEATLVLLALGALVSVQRRGLLEAQTNGVDLLLAATPVLLAGAATVVVLHVMPPVLRTLSRWAAGARGVVPVVSTARASRAAGTAVPIMTLTVAVALMVFCGTTVVSVRHGQEVASQAVVVADVRVDGTIDPTAVERLRAQPDVTIAAAGRLWARSLGSGSALTADVDAVDAAPLAAILRAHGRPVDARLESLARPAAGNHVPTLISPSLATSAARVAPELSSGGGTVHLDVLGTTRAFPRLDSVRPVGGAQPANGEVLVDRATIDRASANPADRSKWVADTPPSATTITTVWVDGPGAAAAVHAAGLDHAEGVTVTTRTTWLAAVRDQPLSAALVWLLLGTALVLAAYAAMALVLTVVATSGERGRTLSALRTLGLDARTARAMTFGELAPLAVAALVAGSVIGIGVPWQLTRSLGLDVATGLAGTTTFTVTWLPIAAAVVVVLVSLAVAVAVESAVRRRDRLGEVLRVGER